MWKEEILLQLREMWHHFLFLTGEKNALKMCLGGEEKIAFVITISCTVLHIPVQYNYHFVLHGTADGATVLSTVS